MAQRRRQDLIMEMIKKNGFVTTEQLVDQFVGGRDHSARRRIAGRRENHVDELLGEVDVRELQSTTHDPTGSEIEGVRDQRGPGVRTVPVEIVSSVYQTLRIAEFRECDLADRSIETVGERAGDDAVLTDREVAQGADG